MTLSSLVPSLSAGLSAEGVSDFSLPFVRASEFSGTEVDFPEPVVDLFESKELLSEEVADVGCKGARGRKRQEAWAAVGDPSGWDR